VPALHGHGGCSLVLDGATEDQHRRTSDTDPPPEPDTQVEAIKPRLGSGTPIEDPGKLKPWGMVGAKAERVQCRAATEEPATATSSQASGPGPGRSFKWASGSRSRRPTTLQRIEFNADRSPRARRRRGHGIRRLPDRGPAAGVSRWLNFTYGEAGARSSARRCARGSWARRADLIANLSLDECLTAARSRSRLPDG